MRSTLVHVSGPDGGSAGTATTVPLSSAEREELERLRAELAALRCGTNASDAAGAARPPPRAVGVARRHGTDRPGRPRRAPLDPRRVDEQPDLGHRPVRRDGEPGDRGSRSPGGARQPDHHRDLRAGRRQTDRRRGGRRARQAGPSAAAGRPAARADRATGGQRPLVHRRQGPGARRQPAVRRGREPGARDIPRADGQGAFRPGRRDLDPGLPRRPGPRGLHRRRQATARRLGFRAGGPDSRGKPDGRPVPREHARPRADRLRVPRHRGHLAALGHPAAARGRGAPREEPAPGPALGRRRGHDRDGGAGRRRCSWDVACSSAACPSRGPRPPRRPSTSSCGSCVLRCGRSSWSASSSPLARS